MKTVEQKAFLSRYGFEPTQIKTAYSSVSVYVHESNPLKEISFEQLESIFSKKDDATEAKTPVISSWSELGVKGPLATVSLMPLAREKNSVAAAYFRQKVLLQNEFNPNVSEISSLHSLFEVIAANKSAIGFGETAQRLPSNIRALKIKKSSDSPAIASTRENIYQGTYPLARELNVYIVRFPGEDLEPGLKDFLSFVLSQKGQLLVVKQGLTPLSVANIREERAKLE
jgi:phosphate transport system substrate-binding protein